MVKRIRGVAYSMRVSPQTSNRLVDGARGVLNALLADVYVFTDHMAGAEAGASPGYGLALVAETTAGRLLSAEAVSPPQLQARKHEFPVCLLQARPPRHLSAGVRKACAVARIACGRLGFPCQHCLPMSALSWQAGNQTNTSMVMDGVLVLGWWLKIIAGPSLGTWHCQRMCNLVCCTLYGRPVASAGAVLLQPSAIHTGNSMHAWPEP